MHQMNDGDGLRWSYPTNVEWADGTETQQDTTKIWNYKQVEYGYQWVPLSGTWPESLNNTITGARFD